MKQGGWGVRGGEQARVQNESCLGQSDLSF